MAPPDRLTAVFGREPEIAQLRDLLVYRREVRLVTLVGPGGVGKTRLAELLLADVREEFGGDVHLVDLAPIREAARVPGAIAEALAVAIPDGREVVETLVERLQGRELLLVLDNFEHVMDADVVVWSLVTGCPDLVVLVTSREPLHVEGQHVFDVPPLDAPPDPDAAVLGDLPRYPALQLFVARARAVRPDLELDDEAIRAIAHVCARLAGLPLAIELAAARMGAISLPDLTAGLDHMLDLLSKGPRNAPPRHRTLRAAIAWSYDLLDPAEQRLFRALSIFAGGCTVATVQATLSMLGSADDVAAGDDARTDALSPTTALDLLSSLVDKALLTATDAEPTGTRFVPLEPIRLFALERLRDAGEEPDALRAHAAAYLALVQEAFPHLRGEESAPWLATLDREHDNLRAALAWAIDQGEASGDTALRLANALWLFWRLRGHFREARHSLERALAAASDAVSDPRADALLLLGHSIDDDDRRSADCYAQARAMYHALGDTRGEAGALTCLGMAAEQMGDYPLALRHLDDSLRLFRAHGGDADIAQAEHQLGRLAASLEDYPRAKAHFEEARSRFLRLGRPGELAYTLLELGRIAGLEQRHDEAEDILTWSLAAFRANDMPDGIGRVLCELGALALRRGDEAAAADAFRQTLALFAEHRWENELVVLSIEGLAQIAVDRGDPALGVQLLGTAAAWRETAARKAKPVEQAALRRVTSRARGALSQRVFAEAWQRGFLLSRVGDAVERAMSFPLHSSGSARGSAIGSTAGPAPARAPRSDDRVARVKLTRAQRVVLCHVAEGWTNQQIADHLNVSVRTVTTHMTAILTALDTDNRAGAAAFAVRHDLCPPP